MIRPLAATVALATLVLIPLAGPGIASAQTWGQPVYLNAYGRPVGGSPLSEFETRSYVETGRRADGYSDRPRVYVPVPGYGRPYGGHGYGTYGYDRDRYRDGSGRYDRPPVPGYRDVWGYNDDRSPTSTRGGPDGHRHRGSRDCGCADVYLYDR
ncbi:hypothetical protein [Brevundimonas sp. TWP2-3-4b2]|uniref:hypothetical protein n=1 Tax=Brevundimonas sp. TWP2-3-4b2 TaxID=2804595 RepID=UPI003CECFBC4